MILDEETASIRAQRVAELKAAEAFTQWRKPLAMNDSKVRFPGFRQGKRVFTAGSRFKPGARTFPVDIVMHESVPTVLPDGVTTYSDVFLPAAFNTLQSCPADIKPVPAIIAWYAFSSIFLHDRTRSLTLLQEPIREARRNRSPR